MRLKLNIIAFALISIGHGGGNLIAQLQASEPDESTRGTGTWDGISETRAATQLLENAGGKDSCANEFDLIVHLRLTISKHFDQELIVYKIRNWLENNSSSNCKNIVSFLSDKKLGIPAWQMDPLVGIKNLERDGLPAGWEVHAGADRSSKSSVFAYVDFIFRTRVALGKYSTMDIDAYLDQTLRKGKANTKSGGDPTNGGNCLADNKIPDASVRGILHLPDP